MADGSGSADRIVIYEIQPSRSGDHVRAFLSHPPPVPLPPWDRAWQQGHVEAPFDPHWRGSLMVDDYIGYKASFKTCDSTGTPHMVELGCWAHVRRKFHELHIANQSTLAARAMFLIGQLYEVERQIVQGQLFAADALALRQTTSKPVTQTLHQWLLASVAQVPHSSATAKAIQYALRRWPALIRYLDDARLPIDNNWAENQIRPCAVGRKNWLFAGSLRAGQRAASVMTLIQTAKINGIEPWQYLNDVLTRLPTHAASQIDELLPTRSGWAAHCPRAKASVEICSIDPAPEPLAAATPVALDNPYHQLLK